MSDLFRASCTHCAADYGLPRNHCHRCGQPNLDCMSGRWERQVRLRQEERALGLRFFEVSRPMSMIYWEAS